MNLFHFSCNMLSTTPSSNDKCSKASFQKRKYNISIKILKIFYAKVTLTLLTIE